MSPGLRFIRLAVAGTLCAALLAAAAGVAVAAAGFASAAERPSVAVTSGRSPSIAVTLPRCLPVRISAVQRRLVVGLAENGGTLCVSLGEQIDVSLAAAPSTAPWQAIRVSPAGILRSLPRPASLKGVTSASFSAARAGTAHLEATRSSCPSSTSTSTSTASCSEIRWTATVIVLGTHTTVGGPQPEPVTTTA